MSSPLYLICTIIQVAVAVVRKPSLSPLGTLLKGAAYDRHESSWALTCSHCIPFWTTYFQRSQESEYWCEIPKTLNTINPFFSKMLWAKSSRSVGVIQSISEYPPFAKKKTPLKTKSKRQTIAKNFLPTPTFCSKGPNPVNWVCLGK